MSNFKVGEKVVCVNDECGWIDSVKFLVKDEIYTVCHTQFAGNGRFEISVNGDFGMWDASRFRKLDTQFAEDICAQLIEEFKQETILN